MSELRFDYTMAEWVVFAPLRKLRPHESARQPQRLDREGEASLRTCPFCPGNERLTPQEIAAWRASGPASTENWSVRVVPNKFPALRIEEDHHRLQEGPVFQHMGGCGAHEVLIESPRHDVVLANQSLEQVELVLRAAHARYTDLMRDPRFVAIVVFKNHGEAAGTSLQHPHWQIIATPVVPRLLRLKLMEATAFYDRTGRSLYEVLLEEELVGGRRVVATTEHFAAFIPYAARLPFETWILPRRAQASFAEMSHDQFAPLAVILRDVLLKMYVGLGDPDFNFIVDTVARGDEREPYFRWHIRILPRLATAAGFELGSGMSINTVLPEDAAEFLRTESATALNHPSA